MVTAVKTWVRCSVSCPGGGTWPFSIQNNGFDDSGSFDDYDDVIDIAQVARRGPSIFKMMAWIVIIITMIMPRWRDVQNSINVFDYIGSFNDYDDVIYDAHLGAGGLLDCV